MRHYTHQVIEYYRDGGTWRHAFTSERNARRAVEDMQEAHKGRRYVLSAILEEVQK